MKRLISVFTIIAVLACFCISFGADTIYRYGGLTLTVLADEEDIAFGVLSYDGDDPAVTVPGDFGGYPILALNSHAFAANTTLREITLSDGIASVGNGAFLSATNLEKVTLTPSVTFIGESAFLNTPALKEINLADSSIEGVSNNAFQSSGIEEIALPETCTAVGDMAFAKCGDLTKISIPDSVKTISDNAFQNSDNVVIYASSGSYAIAYAKAHGLSYVCTDAEAYMLGDADGNGEIEIVDATVIQRVLADIPVADPDTAERNGDVDGDGLNITDATWLQRYLASVEIPYEIGKIVNKNI
nr:leucine-rich repeat protein [uncultured Ruminococcus sp.]